MSVVERLRAQTFNVSDRTNWFFVAAYAQDGSMAWGEASLNGREAALDAALRWCEVRCAGLSIDEARRALVVDPQSIQGLAFNAAVSATRQALSGLRALHAGVPVHATLGSMARNEVQAYANINRATILRTPQGFVATALRAQAEGYTGFKAAPFDGVTPGNAGTLEGQRLIQHGIDCMLALRDALGPVAQLMVDCHWRFDEARAVETLRALAAARLHWFECPLPESRDNWPALRRIRAAARDQGVLLAAAETQVGVAAFQALYDAELYDVVMPDVKYCGGPQEMLTIAQRATDAGVRFSPHNPTGPVCSQYSLHVAAVAPACEWLEMQFDETPLYGRLVGHRQPPLVGGRLLVPSGPGLGVTLDEALLAAHPYRPVPLGIESSLSP